MRLSSTKKDLARIKTIIRQKTPGRQA